MTKLVPLPTKKLVVGGMYNLVVSEPQQAD